MAMNKQQLEAVHHMNGPCCVTAGAGSGKTTVLTHRIENLIKNGINPSSILSITFTKKAAEEMKERLRALIGDPADEVFLGTFHSFGLRVLSFRGKFRGSGQVEREEKERPEILNPQEQIAVISDMCSPDSTMMKKRVLSKIEGEVAMSFISWQKNNLIFPEDDLDFSCLDNGDCIPDTEKEDYRKIYKSYERWKRKKNKIDFDDMLTETYLALKNDAEFRNFYIRKYRYLLVDEFQDTNVAQYELVKLLAGRTQNVFIVGDARQAIYSWRCSNVQFILDFPTAWQNTHVVSLDDNYRSTIEVVDLSTKLIANATINYPGLCRSGLQTHGEPIYSLRTETAQDEADMVAQIIWDFVREQHKGQWHDVAILYRLNAQSLAFENACIALNIPYKVAGATSFFDVREIKEILTYLQFATDTRNMILFNELLKIPTRDIDPNVSTHIANILREHEEVDILSAIIGTWGQSNLSTDKTAQEMIRFAAAIRNAQKMDEDPAKNVGDIIKTLLKETGYIQFAIDRKKNKQREDDGAVLSFLDSFADTCKKFGCIQHLLRYVERAKEKEAAQGENAVQMMSLHRSKGLEFKIVFVVGMVEGVLPHSKSTRYTEEGEIIPESIEEERRLCYVGITRAKEILFLTSYEEKEESPFFRELLPYTKDLGEYYEAVKSEWEPHPMSTPPLNASRLKRELEKALYSGRS